MKALLRLPVALLFIAGLVLFLSCNKSTSGGSTQYFVSAKIDGTDLKNTGYAVATFADLPAVGFKTCSIQGSTSATELTDYISLAIIDASPITTKQYSAIDIGGAIQATITFTDKNSVVYSSAYNTSSDAVINISGLTVNDVSGTFSGTLSNATGSSTVTITNGSFIVKRLY